MRLIAGLLLSLVSTISAADCDVPRIIRDIAYTPGGYEVHYFTYTLSLPEPISRAAVNTNTLIFFQGDKAERRGVSFQQIEEALLMKKSLGLAPFDADDDCAHFAGARSVFGPNDDNPLIEYRVDNGVRFYTLNTQFSDASAVNIYLLYNDELHQIQLHNFSDNDVQAVLKTIRQGRNSNG